MFAGQWKMTEFEIGAHNGVGGRQIDLLQMDGDHPGCLGSVFRNRNY